jgi:DeoR family transcriptional regulator of aga operon
MHRVAGYNGDAKRKIPVQRRSELRDLLRGRGAASIAEISAALGVSASTVRRDLDELDREGLVRRSHGGAVSAERTTFEFRFEDRRHHNAREKASIGGYAASLLEAGQSVLFDSSSTVLCAAEALAETPVGTPNGEAGHALTTGITAVTNDVNVACVLAGLPGASVVVPGGEIRDGSFTLLGPYTQRFLDGLHVDVALMGVHAISGEVLTESSLSVAEAKRAMMRAARRVILLVDNSKFRPPAFFEVARATDVHDLVTDEATPRAALEAANASGALRIHVV